MADQKLTKHSGYIYNNKTREGFQRMKRHGIVLPPFRIEDQVTKLLTNHYDRLITKISQASKGLALLNKAVMDSKEEYLWNLQDSMITSITSDKEKLAEQLARELEKSKEHFFDDLIDDAPDRVSLAISFALDKDEVFQSRIDGLMKLFLDNSLARIEREEDFLKSAFLIDLSDFMLGKTDSLDSLRTVIEAMRETSVRQSRFFARDQFARLNKAMTITSLEQAGASHVKWMTVGDMRTRPTHQALNGKVFPIDRIPEEKDDYNCRCALLGIFDDELK